MAGRKHAAEPTAGLEYSPRISDLVAGDRPRERLKTHGAAVLTNAELLAIVLRVGTQGENVVRLSERLLTEHGGLGGLYRAPMDELVRVRGMGESKVTQIKAALELGRRLMVEAPDERPVVKSPADAANLVLVEMGALEQEQMRTILLDTRNRVLHIQTVYAGNLNSAIVRVGELFREAIRRNCAALIVAHNHPSGDPSPSPDDVRVTEQIVEAGKLLDIEVLDHLVIGHGRYVSLKDRGLGFG
ncbi:MAG: DNA repair protein RadC [Chloroflexi bacterium]|nr:DNA repair protein RadC [Chloroflexota bacterium]